MKMGLDWQLWKCFHSRDALDAHSMEKLHKYLHCNQYFSMRNASHIYPWENQMSKVCAIDFLRWNLFIFLQPEIISNKQIYENHQSRWPDQPQGIKIWENVLQRANLVVSTIFSPLQLLESRILGLRLPQLKYALDDHK